MEVKPFEREESSVEAADVEEEHKSEEPSFNEDVPEISAQPESSSEEEEVKPKSAKKSAGKQSAKSNGKRSSKKATPVESSVQDEEASEEKLVITGGGLGFADEDMEDASSKVEAEAVSSSFASGRVSAKKSSGKGSVAAKKPVQSRPSTAKKVDVVKAV